MRSLVALSVLACASVASADALPADYEPPDCSDLVCPPGTTPAGGGHGSCPNGCSPSQRTCETDADCSASPGSTCVPVRFCIVRRNTARLADVPFVEGEPNAAGQCTTGEPQIGKLCTYPPVQPSSRSSSSDDGCAAGGRTSALSFLLFVLVLRRRYRQA